MAQFCVALTLIGGCFRAILADSATGIASIVCADGDATCQRPPQMGGVSMLQNRITLETAAEDIKLQHGMNRSGGSCKKSCFQDSFKNGQFSAETICESKRCSGCDVCHIISGLQMSMQGVCYLLFINIDEDGNSQLDEHELLSFFSIDHCLDCVASWTGRTYTPEECTDLACGESCPVEFEQFIENMKFLEDAIPYLLQQVIKRPLFLATMEARRLMPPASDVNSPIESKAVDMRPSSLLQQVGENEISSSSPQLKEMHLLSMRKEKSRESDETLDETLVKKIVC